MEPVSIRVLESPVGAEVVKANTEEIEGSLERCAFLGCDLEPDVMQAALGEAVHRRFKERNLLVSEGEGDVEGILLDYGTAKDLLVPLRRALDVTAIEPDVLDAFDGDWFHGGSELHRTRATLGTAGRAHPLFYGKFVGEIPQKRPAS